jgi:hypothetical protein
MLRLKNLSEGEENSCPENAGPVPDMAPQLFSTCVEDVIGTKTTLVPKTVRPRYSNVRKASTITSLPATEAAIAGEMLLRLRAGKG